MQPTIDPPSILEPLNVLDAATFLEQMILAQERVEGCGQATLWQEISDLREEAREVFIRKFFEVN